MGKFFVVFFILCSCLLFSLADAFALYYSGGAGASAGVGRGLTMDAVTLASASPQSFLPSSGSTTAAMLNIIQDAAVSGGGIKAANDIRVRIPAGLDMTWDTSVPAVTVGGSAAAKVSTLVSYEDAGRTLVLDVTSDFADGDAVTVSSLAFTGFNALGRGYLGLDNDNSGNISGLDIMAKEIGGYSGGNGLAFAVGRTAPISVIGVLSAATQVFLPSSPPTAVNALTIYQDAAMGAGGVTAANDMRVTIPAALGMTWDTSVTTLAVSGPSAAKVAAAVSYENAGKTLVLNVTSDFADGDSVTVSGASATGFTSLGQGRLGVEIDNAGHVAVTDIYTKDIGGYAGGGGSTAATTAWTRGDPNTAALGSLF